MTTFHVEIERTERIEFWITCDDKDTALEAADTLRSDFREWEELNDDVDVHEVPHAPVAVPHWLGGPDGRWAPDGAPTAVRGDR